MAEPGIQFLGTRESDDAVLLSVGGQAFSVVDGHAQKLAGPYVALPGRAAQTPLSCYESVRAVVPSSSLPKSPKVRAPRLVKASARRGRDWAKKFNTAVSDTPGAVDICNALTDSDCLSSDVLSHMAAFFGDSSVMSRALGFDPGDPGYPSKQRIIWEMFGGDDGESWVSRVAPHAMTAAAEAAGKEQDDTESTLASPDVEEIDPPYIGTSPHDYIPGNYGLCEVCGYPAGILLHELLGLEREGKAVNEAYAEEDDALVASVEPLSENAEFFFVPDEKSDCITNIYCTDPDMGWGCWSADSKSWDPTDEPDGTISIDAESAWKVIELLTPGGKVHPREIDQAEWALMDEDRDEAMRDIDLAEAMRESGLLSFHSSDNGDVLAHIDGSSLWWSWTQEAGWESLESADFENLDALSVSVAAELSSNDERFDEVYPMAHVASYTAELADEYTPIERSQNAQRQVRDRFGRFARANSRVSYNGQQGVVSRIDPVRQSVTIKNDDGTTVEAPANQIETIKAASPSPSPVTRGPNSEPADITRAIKDIPAEPRATSMTSKAMLPYVLDPLTPDALNKAITDYEKFVADTRAKKLKQFENNPDTSDVKPLRLAIVDPTDTKSVLDLIALVPASATDNTVTAYRRDTGGAWVHAPEIMQQLRSTNPPAVVTLDDKTYPDVLQQVDAYYVKKSEIEAKNAEKQAAPAQPAQPAQPAPMAASAASLWDDYGVLLPMVADGGLDRNRGGAERLRRYWTKGPGAAKIMWGAPGDWRRCVAHLSKYLGVRAKGYCNLRHHEVLGFYPATHAKRDRDKLASDEAMLLSIPPRVIHRMSGDPVEELPSVVLAAEIPTVQQRRDLEYPVVGQRLSVGDTFLMETEQGTVVASVMDTSQVLGWDPPAGRVIYDTTNARVSAILDDGSAW